MLLSIFRLIRPLTGIRFAATACIAAYIQFANIFTIDAIWITQGLLTTLSLFGTSFFLVSALYAFDDIADIDEDKVNHPYRPIPSGQITPNQALAAAWLFLILSLYLSRWVSAWAFLIPLILLPLVSIPRLFHNLESHWLGRSISIFFLILSSFLLGYLTYPTSSNRVLILGFAFSFLHLWTRVIQDLVDLEGDKSGNLKTLPAVYLHQTHSVVKYGLFFSALVIMLPVLFGFEHIYLLFALPASIMLVRHGLSWSPGHIGTKPNHSLALLVLTGALLSS